MAQVRLEGEALLLALDALELCVQLQQQQSQLQEQPQEGGWGDAQGPHAPAPLAADMLHELCAFVILHCAGSALQPGPALPSALPTPTPTAADAAPPLSASATAPPLPMVVVSSTSSCPSSTVAWLECVRAPLLVRTLRTYAQLPQAAQAQEVQRMWGPLLQLGCSTQERVRAAVAMHLEKTVQPMLLRALKAADDGVRGAGGSTTPAIQS